VNDLLVEIQNLSKRFSPKLPLVLDKIEAKIPKGKIVGLVGPDGAGKTTLIRLIAALLLPTEGTIKVDGYDAVKQAEYVHYLTGYMPQRFGLYEDLSVLQNLRLYADLRGIVGAEREETFQRLLKFTGLAPFTERLARALSGGMKQKLGLACALIKKPALLLLDEPSVGVDPISRRELWKMVNDLLKEGISIIWSTAYLDEAQQCDTVLLLNEGKLLYSGDPKELTARVQGRVFKLTEIQGNRRDLLSKVLKEDEVIDGVVQGGDIRIVVKNKPPEIAGCVIKETPPRFEDAFVDILGKKVPAESKLAAMRPMIEKNGHDMIVGEKLTKKFGTFIAVNEISCAVKRGEIFGLLGPNGAGKSTTFKMMCGLLRPTAGKAIVSGLDLQVALGQARAEIGYMAQKFSLYGNLNVQQNLDFFAGIYQLKGKEKEKAIDAAIEIFSLKEFLTTSTDLLPLGFKQRLALACATLHFPEILFLDEPTSGVDPITRREFWNHINGLVGKGVTIMVTTHFMDEADYCDRLALIYRGKIIHMDTPDRLKEISKTPELENPTLEDTFVKLIEEYDAAHPL
jgi:drug efflux transport system ATP-binding protein